MDPGHKAQDDNFCFNLHYPMPAGLAGSIRDGNQYDTFICPD